MRPDQQKHLLELFEAFSQDRLTEPEHRALQALLRADVEARRLWFLNQDLELGLKCLTQVVTTNADRTEEGASNWARFERANVKPDFGSPTSIAESSPRSWATRRNLTMTAVVLFGLSAMVLLGFQIWIRQPDSGHAGGNRMANNRAHNLILESPTHGTTLTLDDLKGKVLALHFLLKTDCPNCLKLAHDYSQLATSNPNVVHLFLKPDSIDEIKVWAGQISQKGLKEPPVIYRDPNARLAKEFGIPDGYQFHGQVIHYPALVLLDRSGKELFRYVGKDNSDRMKPDDFIASLAMVTDHK